MHARYFWLVLFLLINIVYCPLIIAGGELFGESKAVTPPSSGTVIFILILLLASYLYFQVVLFSALKRVKLKPLFQDVRKTGFGDISGKIVLVLQISFVVFFVSTGTYVAGSTARDGSLLSKIWVLIPVDMLFLVFYGTYRDSKYFTPNLVVWIASSLIRGWSGVILTALFIESCRLYRNGKLKAKHVFYGILGLTISYPFILFFKLFIRFLAIGGGDNVQGFFALYESLDISELLLGAAQQAFDRLQLLSSAIAAYQYQHLFQIDFAKGMIAPFWYEGIHGIAMDILFGNEQKLSAGQAFANYIDPFSTDVSWNANPTFVGWLFIAPSAMVFHTLYITTLCAVSFLATMLVRRTNDSLNVIWYTWLSLAIPGWYGALFLYTYSCLLFLGLHFFLAIRHERKTRINRHLPAAASAESRPSGHDRVLF